MKTIKTTLFVSVMLLATLVQAQPRDMRQKREDIKTAKIGIITQRLELSTGQAQKFWPIYNEYEKKQKELRKSMHEIRQREPESDEDYLKIVNDLIRQREKEVELDKTYKDRFLEVISPRQLVELYKAEHEFKRMLLHKLDGRKGQPGRPAAPGKHGGPSAPEVPR